MDKPHVTPKDFFLWFGAMIALYFSVGSLVALLFEYIDRLFGSAAVIGYDPYSGGIRFAIASLVVLFPVYLLITRMLNKEIRTYPLKKDLWVRRWLIFLTIFAAAVGLIIDLVILINTFLGGEELTLAFILKVVTIFALFGGVFYYYLQDIRGVWEQNEKTAKLIGIIVSSLIAIAIISGFFIMGSPQSQRMLRYDQQRVSDLEVLQSQITNYYRSTESLPADISSLEDPLIGGYIPTDPETGDMYEYIPGEGLSFELCATFSLSLPKIDETAVDKTSYQVRELLRIEKEWPHDVGRTCFERTIDPERVKTDKELVRPSTF